MTGFVTPLVVEAQVELPRTVKLKRVFSMKYIPTEPQPVKPNLAGDIANLPTRDKVCEFLDYDRKTGVFTWRVDRRGRAKAGTKAGTLAGKGHIQIAIRGTRHYAHRLAWLVTYGEWPPADTDIDHIDGNMANNAINNLRLASRSQNAHNAAGLRKNNTSGFRGVSYYRRTRRWEARILVEGVNHHLGYHDSAEDAARAYDRASLRLNGEFATFNFPDERPTYGQLLSAFRWAMSLLSRPAQNKFDMGLAGGMA